MTTTTPSAALVLAEPVFSDQERLALAGFLAGYRSLTREAYALDLRQYAAWCHRRQLCLFQARRADASAQDRAGDRPGHRRAMLRPDLPDPRRGTAGPARCGPDGPPGRPPRRAH